MRKAWMESWNSGTNCWAILSLGRWIWFFIYLIILEFSRSHNASINCFFSSKAAKERRWMWWLPQHMLSSAKWADNEFRCFRSDFGPWWTLVSQLPEALYLPVLYKKYSEQTRYRTTHIAWQPAPSAEYVKYLAKHELYNTSGSPSTPMFYEIAVGFHHLKADIWVRWFRRR